MPPDDIIPTDVIILPPARRPRRVPVDDHFPVLLKATKPLDAAPAGRSPVPLSAGSVLTSDQLAAVVRALAKPDEIAGLPHAMPDALALRVAQVVAVALNLPAGPRPHRVGRPPEGPRLVPRDRGDGSPPVLYLHDGDVRRSTNFTADEADQAEAVLRLHKMFKDAEVVGQVLPTQVLVDVVIAFWLVSHKPTGETSLGQVATYENDRVRARRLLEFFGGKRLVDLTAQAIEAFGEWRMSLPGKMLDRAGKKLPASDQTVRGDLIVLEKALAHWKTQTGLQWSPSIPKPKKNPARVAWLYRGEAARALLGARGWLWDREAGGWKTVKVWDPLGREYFVDPATGRLRSRRLGHGAWVLRPQVWRDRHGKVRRKDGAARALIVGFYTGTRADALRQLRWKPDGVHGYPDFAKRILYRSDIGWPKTTKKQGPVDMCARLWQHMWRWMVRDGKTGINWIVHSGLGRQFSRQLDEPIRWAMRNAGMHPMPVTEDDLRFVDVKGKLILVTLHVYRHTFATMLLAMGVSEAEVARQLDITMPLLHATYGHHTHNGSKDVRAALDSMRLFDIRDMFQD